MKVIESRDVQVEVPLDVRDIKNILNNEPQRLVKDKTLHGSLLKFCIKRLSTYIADPRQELKPSNVWQTFRDIKIDGVPVPFVLCLR